MGVYGGRGERYGDTLLEVEEEVVAQLGVGDDVVGWQVSAEGADGAAAALRRVAAITSPAHRHRRSTPSSSSSSQSAPQRRPAPELTLTPTHAHTTTDAAVHRPSADAGPVHDAVVAVDAVDGHHEPVVLAAADAGRVEVAGGGGAGGGCREGVARAGPGAVAGVEASVHALLQAPATADDDGEDGAQGGGDDAAGDVGPEERGEGDGQHADLPGHLQDGER